ncbi:unnamed protein product [Owenia fusiformis]|uniref:Phospholipid scramblase n=1 Tax=Owenia fusiformis TaxID=6347 RepID=A0A8J1XRV3_OWEFU|nr:unnamed protein product [Owenia fusiformis]
MTEPAIQYQPGQQPPPQGYAQGYAPPQQYGQPQYGQPGQPGMYPQVPGGQPGAPGPVANQPNFMEKPQVSGCPPGLEYLTQIDQILVHQQVELLEVVTGFETQNKYEIKNSMGQQVYFAQEESGCCMRQCCGPGRGFTMHITDNLGQEVIRCRRPFKCCAGCCWCASAECCAYTLIVETPAGEVLGTVRQACSPWTPKFTIMDANDQTIFDVKGPCCICVGPCCTWDQEFVVTQPDSGHEVGKVSKQWSGLVKEMFTDADNFGISFPMDLDVKIKAVMIGAVFLIDLMYFQKRNNNNNHWQGDDGVMFLE